MTAAKTSIQQGREAIRERNFSTAIQLLRRAYRQDPSADNALWLASAYTEAGYAQLASLYKEIYQEKTGVTVSSKPVAPAPAASPAPVVPASTTSPPVPKPLPLRRPTPLPKRSPSPPVSWDYTPAPIDPSTLTQPPIPAPAPTPKPPPPSPASDYLPARHAPDLSHPESGTPLSRRLAALHRQFQDRATPYLAEIALQLAEAYDEQENYKAAQRYYREVLDLDVSLMLRPMVLERLEEIRSLHEDGSKPDAHRLLEMAEQQHQAGQVEMAERLYRQLLRSNAPLSVHNAARKGLIRLYPDGKR